MGVALRMKRVTRSQALKGRNILTNGVALRIKSKKNGTIISAELYTHRIQHQV